MTFEDVTERVGEAGLLEVDNVLKDIVAERILNQMEGTVSDLADELGFLMASGVVYTALQHATAVTMGSNRNAIGANGIKNELSGSIRVLLGYEGHHTWASLGERRLRHF